VFQQISIIFPSSKFHGYPSSGSCFDTSGYRDWWR